LGEVRLHTTQSGTKATQVGGHNSRLGAETASSRGTSKAYYSRGESSSGAELTSSGMSSSSSSSSRIPFSRGCSTAPPSMAAAVLSVPSGGACGVLKSPPHPVMGVPIRTWVSPIAGDGCSAAGPLLHAPILDLPEAFLGDGFATYSSRGPCFGLSHPDLVHPYCKLCLLSPVGLLL
jgi:hypothetical protein